MMIIMYTLCFYDAIFISGIGVFLFFMALLGLSLFGLFIVIIYPVSLG